MSPYKKFFLILYLYFSYESRPIISWWSVVLLIDVQSADLPHGQLAAGCYVYVCSTMHCLPRMLSEYTMAPCHPVRFCCPARRGYSSLWNGARDVNNALPLPVLAAQKRAALCACLTVHACVQQRMRACPVQRRITPCTASTAHAACMQLVD
jgi:hypothetical protein